MRKVVFSALTVAMLHSWPMAAATRSVLVEAGAYARLDTVVSVPVPAVEPPLNCIIIDGRPVPLQLSEGNRIGSFVLRKLAPGQRAVCLLTNGEPDLLPLARLQPWQVRREREKLTLKLYPESARLSLLEYQAEPGPFPRADVKEIYRRGGYLHPIRTLNGRAVTDDFPANHVHHHGVWSAWTSTRFDGRKPDFWNMGQGRGRVDFVALDREWSGPVHSGFTARHRFVDLTGPQPAPALEETWEVKVYTPFSSYHWYLDLTSTQRCASTNALLLPEYHYGGIGWRGPYEWNGATNMLFCTSEGETDRVKAHGQRGRWCDMSGWVANAYVGLAVLCHPTNFRAPQPMRVHPDEPFFSYAPQQLGDMAIRPGETYVSRYRFVAHDGAMSREELDRLWNDYAHPPVARLVDGP